MNKKRPVNLDLLTIRFPITAIVSILHRASGVILFLSIPILLCVLSCSLSTSDNFDNIVSFMQSFWVKLMTFAILSAALYHFIAGLRHLLMDTGVGEEKTSGKIVAKVMLATAMVVIILMGVWLWM